MIPTLSAPNIQVPPPVETSVFTGQNADAALGRLPVVTVPPTVTSAKVADDTRSQQQARNPQQNSTPAAESFSVSTQMGAGELVFESPYSTTFVAQLFGQFQTADETLGALSGQSAEAPLGFVDFDRLSQFDITKYMPSFAFRPQVETPAVSEQPRVQAAVSAPAPVASEQVAAAPVADLPADTAEVALPLPASTTDNVEFAPAPVISAGEPAAEPALPQPSAEQAPTIPAPREPVAAQSLREVASNVVSLFSRGSDAYGATQSRNLFNIAGGAAAAQSQFSLVL